jgi:hypothetical protein
VAGSQVMNGQGYGTVESPRMRRAPVVAYALTSLVILLVSLLLCACRKGSSEVLGWQATQPGMDLRIEPGAGPGGQDVLAALYTIMPPREYSLERRMPASGLQGIPKLKLMGRATRVLHLSLVLLDKEGAAHECVRTLQPGDWRELVFDQFRPEIDGWSDVEQLRLADLTGTLGGQGPVSLKLVGLP